jgi:hypothetical protein
VQKTGAMIDAAPVRTGQPIPPAVAALGTPRPALVVWLRHVG